MRSAYDFAPFRRSTVGFDRLFDLLESSAAGQTQDNYPPFDLISVDENSFRVSLAVAGFAQNEIDITAQQNQLIVSGRKQDDDGANYIHRGIANRTFERRFGLADHIKVTGAVLKNGLLSIELVREIPEAMRARKIEISGGDEMQAINDESARKPKKDLGGSVRPNAPLLKQARVGAGPCPVPASQVHPSVTSTARLR